ncbi:universal stress protein [Dissulfurispira thermophila]|uniref:Universal stress protein n=1 Tax=Dissulfurispira thermophila TaxID=2715679 RepID=A0A7G1H245_9BACT|nr:universal stress protein [Dissulfurispira thermophila]BCB96233.1 universal stress protein [Dissulfurispira thermophila]
MLKRILVAFDGSSQSYQAFDFALEMSKLCPGAAPEIFVVSVAQPPEPADIVEVDAIIDSATEHYEELFKKLRERAKERNLEIKTEVVVGHPADQIVKYAKDKNCDMVVLGQRGKSKIESYLLGSVSKRVATYAPCTVTIVKK